MSSLHETPGLDLSSSHTPPPQQYGALSDERLEIRLLSVDGVLPQSPGRDSILRCSLKTVSLLERPNYDALSYCWGTANDPTTHIIVDGWYRKVTRSLAEALRYLGIGNNCAVSPLWVDFVCIDQANKVEKARQILLMNRIFARASTVYAWLGPASPQAEFAMDVLTQLKVGSLGDNLPVFLIRFIERTLLPIFENALWRRVWIIQELSTAGNLVLLWGPHRLQWETFSAACKTVEFRNSFGILDSEPLDVIHNFRRQEQEILMTARRASLLAALIDTSPCLATEPRDKIYALLNLTSDARDILPFPNYSQRDEDIISEVANGIIVRQQKFCAILLAGRSKRDLPQMIFPSWMPNLLDLDMSVPKWVRAGVKRTIITQSIELSASAGALRVTGTRITTISKPYPDSLTRARRDYPVLRVTSTYPAGSPEQLETTALLHVCDSIAYLTESVMNDESYDYMLYELYWNRMQLIQTIGASLWVVCDCATVGDEIVLLPNCALPVVLRPVRDYYIFVGEALPQMEWYTSGCRSESNQGSSESAEPFPFTYTIR